MIVYMETKGTNMKITVTPQFTTRIVGVVAAECVSDGGKWALMCEHLVDGEWLNAGIIQDTNKKRLSSWANVKRGAGYTEWCPECQDAHRAETGEW